MPDGITSDSIRRAIQRLKMKFEDSADELNELDGALGDGDLGVTMTRSLGRLAGDAPTLPDDVGMALLRCAPTNCTVVPWSEVSSLLEAALAAMASRGKAQLGDKTVLDAVDAARRATQGLDDPAALIEAAGRSIAEAVAQLRDCPFRQGRARIFGTKGIGRDDPGMITFQRMIEGLA
jgi:dihydroxyacetone kinase-like protein